MPVQPGAIEILLHLFWFGLNQGVVWYTRGVYLSKEAEKPEASNLPLRQGEVCVLVWYVFCVCVCVCVRVPHVCCVYMCQCLCMCRCVVNVCVCVFLIHQCVHVCMYICLYVVKVGVSV